MLGLCAKQQWHEEDRGRSSGLKDSSLGVSKTTVWMWHQWRRSQVSGVEAVLVTEASEFLVSERWFQDGTNGLTKKVAGELMIEHLGLEKKSKEGMCGCLTQEGTASEMCSSYAFSWGMAVGVKREKGRKSGGKGHNMKTLHRQESHLSLPLLKF